MLSEEAKKAIGTILRWFVARASKTRLETAKDISSFANTKGGTIIYGIPERHVPDGAEEKIIPESVYGIEPIQDFESRLENALTDTISPHLPDLWIRKVQISQQPNYVVYIVWQIKPYSPSIG